MLRDNKTYRVLLGLATCHNCNFSWFLVTPLSTKSQDGSTKYECAECGKMEGECSPKWRISGTALETENHATILLDGYTETFEGARLMIASVKAKEFFLGLVAKELEGNTGS